MEKKEVELPGEIIVTRGREAAAKAEMKRRKTSFTTEKLDEKRRKLGNKEFNKQRPKLAKEADADWEQLHKAEADIRKLEDEMTRKIIDWTPLGKAYRAKLEAEGYPKEVIEKTLQTRKRSFDHAQKTVQGRLRPKVDPTEDFKRRVLNAETRREAIKKYLVNHVNKAHFTIEAFDLIFEELEKQERR